MESLLATPPFAGITLRHRLRNETAAIHQSLHQNGGLQKLISDDCSSTDYLNVLTLFFHFYRTVDRLFDFVLPEQRFIHEAKPLLWLEKDFTELNQPVPELSPSLLAEFVDNSSMERWFSSTPREIYIGYLYVKQGSTLGGQTISKQLKKLLSLDPGVNQFFFNGFGDQTGNYWKEFLNYLSQQEASLNADQVVHSAQTWFAILDQFSVHYFPREGINGYR